MTTTLQTLQLIPIVYFLVVSIPLLIANLRERRLKNIYVLPGLPLWLLCATTYAVLSGDWISSLVVPLLMFLALFTIFFYLSTKDIVGMGDVKLTTILTLTISSQSIWVWLSFPIITIAVGIICFTILYIKKNIEILAMGPIIFIVYFAHLVFLFTK